MLFLASKEFRLFEIIALQKSRARLISFPLLKTLILIVNNDDINLYLSDKKNFVSYLC